MSQRPQHFTFADARFDSVVAHGGEGRISSARVVAAGGGVEFIDLVILPPGSTIGEHTHAADEETYVIVSGSATMIVDGFSLTVAAGDVIVNRPGGTHGLRNTGSEPLRLVVLDVAAGGERRSSGHTVNPVLRGTGDGGT